MELRDAINQRRSIRGYQESSVSKEEIRQVLELAVRAVSGVNSQPWEFFVAAGDKLERLKEYNTAAFRRQDAEDRVDPGVPNGIYRDRSRTGG